MPEEALPDSIAQALTGFVFNDTAHPVTELPTDLGSADWAWCHFDRDHAASCCALPGKNIPEAALDVLMAEHTRPMFKVIGDGLLFVGRGLPDDTNATPDDTVSIRAWLEPRRLITVSMRPIVGVQTLLHGVERGFVPANPAEALIRIVDVMSERVAVAVQEISDRLDEVNQGVIDEGVSVTTAEIAPLRIRAIVLHRYLGPLNTALHDLRNARAGWLTEENRADLGVVLDRVTRTVEDLDSAQSRAAVARDEIVSQQNESLSRRLYGLTMLTAVFLPLTFVTGALGMNLAGIPFRDSPWSFGVALAASAVIVLGEVLILKRLRWL